MILRCSSARGARRQSSVECGCEGVRSRHPARRLSLRARGANTRHVAHDRFGIAISTVRCANPQVKPLALASQDRGPYYPATQANLISQKYPLTRIIPAFIDRVPGEPIDPKLREFLRYILGREGQRALLTQSGYCRSAWIQSRATGEVGVTLNEVITVWGTAQAQSLVRRWEVGFRKSHPSVHVESRLTGSDVGMAGLYTGFADLAVLGRECTAFESKAFEWIFRYPPAQIQIMTGSLGQAEQSPALIAFVHRDNPLAQLTSCSSMPSSAMSDWAVRATASVRGRSRPAR